MRQILRTLITAYAGVLACSSARADMIFSIQPSTVTAAPGDIGDVLDVVLKNTGLSSISVQSFAFEVSVSDPDITFTGANFSTALPYIFAGNSFDVNNSLPLDADGPGQVVDGSDLTNDFTGVTLASGQSLALGHLLFNVSPSAVTGLVPVSFTGPTVSNSLSDPSGGNIPLGTPSGGNINVSNVSTTPEPSSIFLMVVGMAGMGAWSRRRRA